MSCSSVVSMLPLSQPQYRLGGAADEECWCDSGQGVLFQFDIVDLRERA